VITFVSSSAFDSNLTYTQFLAGDDFSLALTVDGKIYTTGKNDVLFYFFIFKWGQLGSGTTSAYRATVQQISGSHTNISSVYTRYQQTLFIKDSKLYSFGYNVVNLCF
jgi:alpha-tubulin suppressor-like RCC1 family protein